MRDDELEPQDDDLDENDAELDDEPLPQRAETPVQAEPEQIGSLVFVPNADYPYPFKVDAPPRFWMEETTGALGDAVDAYMAGERLSAEQLDAIKTYLRQFIERAVLSGDANKKLLASKIEKLKTTADVERFADEASEYGAEVF
jgi:hypothetical protein